jgi:hypothetical protein
LVLVFRENKVKRETKVIKVLLDFKELKVFKVKMDFLVVKDFRV